MLKSLTRNPPLTRSVNSAEHICNNENRESSHNSININIFGGFVWAPKSPITFGWLSRLQFWQNHKSTGMLSIG